MMGKRSEGKMVLVTRWILNFMLVSECLYLSPYRFCYNTQETIMPLSLRNTMFCISLYI